VQVMGMSKHKEQQESCRQGFQQWSSCFTTTSYALLAQQAAAADPIDLLLLGLHCRQQGAGVRCWRADLHR
jgi:hypothetical protein